MVRVPGSSGDSGFHRESTKEEPKIKMEPGIEVKTDKGSPSTPSKAQGSDERASLKGSSDAVMKKEGSAMDLEEKPPIPLLAPPGAPAGRDASRDPPGEDLTAKAEGPSPTATTLDSSASLKTKKPKPTRRKMKAPESDNEDRAEVPTWTEEELEWLYNKRDLLKLLSHDPVMKIMDLKLPKQLLGPATVPKEPSDTLDAVKALMRLLKEAGIVAGVFDANKLFDLDVALIRETTLTLLAKLNPLVGSVIPRQRTRLPSVHSQTGSSQYASATSDAGSDDSIKSPRPNLDPSGASMLRERKQTVAPIKEQAATPKSPSVMSQAAGSPSNLDRDSTATERLQAQFNAAMARFLAEQRTTAQAPQVPKPDPTPTPGARDVEMEDVESKPDHSHLSEYDLDELIDATTSAAVATAGAATRGSTAAPRIRVSAISALKEYSGKDGDEERARAWLSKVKSAFIRDQAPDSEKCIVFGDLLTGPARNWYRQLSRTTRNSWKSLLNEFQIQYCGRGVSVARQYYHARNRADESPLDYLFRLNVAGMRAKIQIKDGSPDVRREHVDHFIETLDDQLALLRIPDADSLEETLRSRQRAKARQTKSAYGSIKQKKPSNGAAPSAPARAVRAIRTAENANDSEREASGSEGEDDVRRIYLAAADDQPLGSDRQKPNPKQTRPDRSAEDRRTDRQKDSSADGAPRKPCAHCGSKKHTDLGCWRRLTCGKCGKTGHPTDHCLYVCKACGEVHDAGACPMEEFYNLIRQWYDPSKHGGMLPQGAEKMLN